MSQPGPPASASTEQTLDLRDYIAPVWQRRWLILILVVLAAGGAYFLAARQRSADLKHRVYQASTQVYIDVANPTQLIGSSAVSAPPPPNGQQMSDIATLFTDQSITQAVSKALGMRASTAGRVDASILNTGSAATYGSSIIVVTATSSSGPLAARLANAYVTQFLAARKRTEASAAAAQANALTVELGSVPKTSASERESLRLQIAGLRAVALSPQPGASQPNPAVSPGAPLPSGSPRTPIVDAVIAGIVALLLGIGLAFAASVFDRRLRRVATVEASYGVPVLGVLPHVARTGRRVEGRAIVPPEFVETFRSLRVTLRLLGDGAGMRSLVVTSALPGEGKSTVATHLALACVESGERVLLIDADLRRPSVASWFRVQPPAGLLQVLRGEVSLADAIVPLHGAAPGDHGHTGNGNGNGGHLAPPGARGALSLLVDGGHTDAPPALLATRAMASVLEIASKRYDIVIVDTAPVLVVADTVPMLGAADAVLLVARLGATTRDAGERLAEVIRRVPDSHVVGVVANDAQDSLLGGGYAGLYSTGRGSYGYGYTNGGGRSRRRSAARSR